MPVDEGVHAAERGPGEFAEREVGFLVVDVQQERLDVLQPIVGIQILLLADSRDDVPAGFGEKPDADVPEAARGARYDDCFR